MNLMGHFWGCFHCLQVFEFLEDISASLTDLATRELSILKDLKVRVYACFLFPASPFVPYPSSEKCLTCICVMIIREERRESFRLESRIYCTMQRGLKNSGLILTLEPSNSTFLSIWFYLESSRYFKTFLVTIHI